MCPKSRPVCEGYVGGPGSSFKVIGTCVKLRPRLWLLQWASNWAPLLPILLVKVRTAHGPPDGLS